MATKKSEMSQDTKTIITVLLLVFAYPIGLIMMFVWMDWKWWIKLLVVLIPILPFMIVMSLILTMVLSLANPTAQINKANEAVVRNEASEMILETTKYYAAHKAYPWGNKVGYESADVVKEAWYTKLTTDNPELENLKNQFTLKQTTEGVVVCYQSISEGTQVCLP